MKSIGIAIGLCFAMAATVDEVAAKPEAEKEIWSKDGCSLEVSQ
jgi:hypothetical protein